MRLLPRFSLNRLRGAGILDDAAERVFEAPPFTPEIVNALRLITTRLPLKADETSRLLCEKEANGMSEREYEALQPLLNQMAKPQKILEIGPGFGRSVVWFGKKGIWSADADIHLYEAAGTQTKYKQRYYDAPPQWPDTSSFCGNFEILQSFLKYNGIDRFSIFDAAKIPMRQLPGPYDFIYAFFSMGYHWSLEQYLDDLAPLMNEQTLLVCTLNKHFKPFSKLNEYFHRVLDCRNTKKGARPLKLLALSPSELPDDKG